jgi:hypothetical protein
MLRGGGFFSSEHKVIGNVNKPGAPGTVAHAYNPSYSGGRDREDHGLEPAGANST